MDRTDTVATIHESAWPSTGHKFFTCMVPPFAGKSSKRTASRAVCYWQTEQVARALPTDLAASVGRSVAAGKESTESLRNYLKGKGVDSMAQSDVATFQDAKTGETSSPIFSEAICLGNMEKDARKQEERTEAPGVPRTASTPNTTAMVIENKSSKESSTERWSCADGHPNGEWSILPVPLSNKQIPENIERGSSTMDPTCRLSQR